MKILIFGRHSGLAKGIKKHIKGCAISDVDVTDMRSVWEVAWDYDVLINCAGVIYPQEVLGTSINLWKREIEVNLIGSYNVARCLRTSNKAIFISSTSGLKGRAGWSGYCASKAGVISLVQSLAEEDRDAYCISPGRINTGLRKKLGFEDNPNSLLEPKEVANIVQMCIDGCYYPGSNIIIRKGEGVRVE